jgi:uncharacterized protein (TIGR03435 family)
MCCVASPGGVGFGQDAGARPAFEAASVKRSVARDGNAAGVIRGGPGTEDPGRITYLNAPLRLMLTLAYGFQGNDELESPGWMSTERYDLAANVPLGATREQCNQMLEDLLIERFGIKLHHETRAFDGYRLAQVKNGSKLREVSASVAPAAIPDGFPPLRPGDVSGIEVGAGDGTYRLTVRHKSISFLLQLLSAQLKGATIDDQTGLTGIYDYNLGFVPARFLDPDQPGRFPDIRTAVEEQLGLKLVEEKRALDVVVIDKANPEPSAN